MTAVRREHAVRPDAGRGLRSHRIAASDRRLPKLAVPLEQQRLSAGVPRQPLDRTLAGHQPPRPLRRRVQVRNIPGGDAGLIPGKGNMPAVGRPDRIRRVLNLYELVDGNPVRIDRGSDRCVRSHK